MPLNLLDLGRVVLAALALLLPGLALAPLFLGSRRSSFGPYLLAAGLVGLGGLALTFWVAARLHGSLMGAMVAWAAVGVIGAIAGRWFRRSDPMADTFAFFQGSRSAWFARILLLSALVALPFGTYVSGGADTWEYFNRAAHIQRQGALMAGSPYDPGLHAPYDPTFYGMLASVATLSGVDVPTTGSIMTMILTPLELGAVMLAVTWIIGSASAGLWAGLIYLVVYGPFFLFRNSLHHQMVADALFLVAWGAIFLHRRSGGNRLLVLAGFMAAAAATLHHFLVVQCAFVIGLTGLSFLLHDRKAGNPIRSAVMETLSVAIGLLPVVLVLATTHLDAVDPKAMDQFFRDVYAPLRHFGSLYIPDPFTWYFQRFWHPLPALLLLFWFWPRARQDARVVALMVVLVVPILVVLNPVVFPMVAHVAGLQVTTRLLNLTLFPSLVLLAWALADWSANRRVARPAGLLALVSILLIAPQTLIRIQGDYFPAARAREAGESPVSWLGALARLRSEATAGQTVMADPITSYSIPTFAPLSIVAHQRADFAFQAENHAERRHWQEIVIDPLSSPDSTLLALNRSGTDWILMNRRFVNPLAFDKMELMRQTMPGLRRAFEVDGIAAWTWDPSVPGMAPTAESVLRQLLIPHEMFGSFLEPGTGVEFNRASGIGAVVGPDQIGLGDTLYVTLYYEWRPTAVGPNWYVKLLREEAYGSRSRWFGRQWRGAVLGRADAVLFPRPLAYEAFRSRHLTTGTVMADQFNLMIPRELTPGRYVLYAAPGGFPTEGNFGIKLGSVEIVRRRIDSESAMQLDSGQGARTGARPDSKQHQGRQETPSGKHLPGIAAGHAPLDHAMMVQSEAGEKQDER